MKRDEIRLNNFLLLLEEERRHGDAPMKQMSERLGQSYSRNYLSKIKAGKQPISNKFCEILQKAYKKPADWMDADRKGFNEPIFNTAFTKNAQNETIHSYQIPLNYVPVYKLEWFPNPMSYIKSHPEESRVAPCILPLSATAFAFVVASDSMQSSGSDSFPLGAVVIVDPEKPCRPGCFALIKIDGSDIPVFRRYVVDGETVHLQALNPSYKTIETQIDQCEIIGVACQTIISY